MTKAKVHATELLKRQNSQLDKYSHIPLNGKLKSTQDSTPSLHSTTHDQNSIPSQNVNVDNLLAKFRQNHVSQKPQNKTYTSPPPKGVRIPPTSPISQNNQTRQHQTKNVGNQEIYDDMSQINMQVQNTNSQVLNSTSQPQNMGHVVNNQIPNIPPTMQSLNVSQVSNSIQNVISKNHSSNPVQMQTVQSSNSLLNSNIDDRTTTMQNINSVSPPKKRKSPDYDDENHYRNVMKKVDSIRDHLDLADEQGESINSDLYSLFNDLQGISADFGISFDTPELVVVGMQSGMYIFEMRFV